jgi:uncharacterized membrane protein YbhN (UPF0104 family)
MLIGDRPSVICDAFGSNSGASVRADGVNGELKGRPAAWRGFLVRVFFTAACLMTLAVLVDYGRLWADLSRIDGIYIGLALALHAIIVALLGWRWRTILAALGEWRRIDWAIGLTFVATLLNLILPLSLGGDIGRVLLGRRSDIGLAVGTTVAVFDRVIGMAALALLALPAALLIPSMSAASPWLWMAALLVPVCVLVAMLGLTAAVVLARRWEIARRITDFAGRFRRFVDQPLLLATITLQSLGGHLLAIVVTYVIAAGLGLPLTLAQSLLLMPAVLLAAALPLSLGGWGVREAAAVQMLGLAGISSTGALAIALLFGLTQLATAGLGSLAWLVLGGRNAVKPAP